MRKTRPRGSSEDSSLSASICWMQFFVAWVSAISGGLQVQPAPVRAPYFPDSTVYRRENSPGAAVDAGTGTTRFTSAEKALGTTIASPEDHSTASVFRPGERIFTRVTPEGTGIDAPAEAKSSQWGPAGDSQQKRVFPSSVAGTGTVSMEMNDCLASARPDPADEAGATIQTL